MKILYVTNHLNGTDGWSKYTLELAKTVKAFGHNVLCLVNTKSKQIEINERVVLDDELKYLANPLRSLITAISLLKIIREFNPDIIHFVVEPYSTVLPFLYLGNRNIKTFLTVHGTYSFIPNLFENRFRRMISIFLTRLVYKKIDGIIAVSNYTKEFLIKDFKKTYSKDIGSKIEVITNGIDSQRFKFSLFKTKHLNKTKQILFVGAVKKRKGVLEAIDAIRFYYEKYSEDFIFNIVGAYNENNNYYRTILQKIKDYNLQDKVILRGSVTDSKLEQYYKRADLFLMLSINNGREFEGYGLVYLEANSYGVPCIGSNDSGSSEAILDAKTGYTVDEHSVEGVAEKIDIVLNNDVITSQNCVDWAIRNDIGIKAKEIINYYTICKKN